MNVGKMENTQKCLKPVEPVVEPGTGHRTGSTKKLVFKTLVYVYMCV